MARPKARELTERELEVMHAVWDLGETTVAEVRDRLADQGRDLAHTTVSTLMRILHEKGFLRMTCEERPYRYEPIRSFEDVSGNLVGELLQRVFGGKRDALLMRLFDRQRLTSQERKVLEQILKESKR
ncbi:MAG: BlaI/MecI/CopY family transcriptional regulator [Planctomyces sp.]|nr:BlaI/MecI/CopY family transcriptional regulator [Planctomyces sp.]